MNRMRHIFNHETWNT